MKVSGYLIRYSPWHVFTFFLHSYTLTFTFSHCVKSVQIRSFFWSVFPYIQCEYRKIRTRKTPYLDTFHAVSVFSKSTHALIYDIYLFFFLFLYVVNLDNTKRCIQNSVKYLSPSFRKIVKLLKIVWERLLRLCVTQKAELTRKSFFYIFFLFLLVRVTNIALINMAWEIIVSTFWNS